MAEETAPVPLESKEEVPAASTSAEQTEGEDVDIEAKRLMGVGSRNLVMKDIRSAVNAFQEASSLLGKKYGETADQCADAFFYYGMALLELARMENGVLGNALEGIPEDEEEDGEKEEDDPSIPSASDLAETERQQLREQVYDAMAEKEDKSGNEAENEKETKEQTTDKKDEEKVNGKDEETGDVDMEVTESMDTEQANEASPENTTEKEAQADKAKDSTEAVPDVKGAGESKDGKPEEKEADSTQGTEIKPTDSTQDAENKPADSTQGADHKPADSTQDVEKKPADSTQDADKKPADSSKDAEIKPVDSGKDSEKPADSMEDAEKKPVASSKDTEKKPVASSKDAEKKPVEAAEKKPVEAADKKPVEAADKKPVEAADKKPADSVKDAEMKPADSTEETKDAPETPSKTEESAAKEESTNEKEDEEEAMEGEEEEGSESDENEGTEEKETEEEVDNLQLAWEMLDLSKIIFKRQQDKASQLKAAEAHLKLGEVSVESENYSQAVEDFLACLNIQKEHMEEHDRLLAETHYQLGLAYQYSAKHEEAIAHFTHSITVIEKRMAVLTEQLEKAAGSPDEHTKEMEELKGLLPDIKEKIEDLKEAQKTAAVTVKALQETLAGATAETPKENGGTSASASLELTIDCSVPVTNCVSDISHLVRKKRKPEDESPVKEAKKPKPDPVENGAGAGDAVVPTNEEVEKAEEEEKPLPMETAAVESTA